MKDLIIESLKKEMENKLQMLVQAQDKEASLAKVIQSLTIQNEMMTA